MTLTWVECQDSTHGTAILELFNHAILHSTALYDYKPRQREQITQWFAIKKAHDYPVIGLENEQGMLCGFATYGSFRALPAYHYTVEHAVYVHPNYIGQGLGKLLLERLIECAIGQDYHVMMGVIDSKNQASVALHEKLGFKCVGNIPEVGYKFGQWLDAAFYQKILPTPQYPKEG